MNYHPALYRWSEHSLQCEKCGHYLYLTEFADKNLEKMIGGGTSLGGAFLHYHESNDCKPFTLEDMEAHGIQVT